MRTVEARDRERALTGQRLLSVLAILLVFRTRLALGNELLHVWRDADALRRIVARSAETRWILCDGVHRAADRTADARVDWRVEEAVFCLHDAEDGRGGEREGAEMHYEIMRRGTDGCVL